MYVNGGQYVCALRKSASMCWNGAGEMDGGRPSFAGTDCTGYGTNQCVSGYVLETTE